MMEIEKIKEEFGDDNFIGEVKINKVIPAANPPHKKVYIVKFAGGSRTIWHYHEEEQMLFILDGTCALKLQNQETVYLQAGERVTIPAKVIHWHGSANEAPMSHLAMQSGDTKWLKELED